MVTYEVLLGDCRETMKTLPDGSVHTVVTSPPYFGLRDYGEDEQIGLEATPDEFVQALVEVFREVRRVLRDDGTVWLNLGDSYSQDKQLFGVPWKVAFALQADGWRLRQDIIWNKPNCMPEPVKDRCRKVHEYIFLLSKSKVYHFDAAAIREPVKESSLKRAVSKGGREKGFKSDHPSAGKNSDIDVDSMLGRFVDPERGANKRSVWTVTTKGNGLSGHAKVHFATYPPELIEPCILAGCPPGGTVLDPFGGSGTTAGVALKHGRNAILCELNPDYAALVDERVRLISEHVEEDVADTEWL